MHIDENSNLPTYYGYGKNVLYHNSEIYFIEKLAWGQSNTLSKVNKSYRKIKKFYRYSKLGMQKHNNIIFAIDSYNNKFLYDTSTDVHRSSTSLHLEML